MKKLLVWSSAIACLCAAIVVSAQPPQDGGGKRGQKGQGGRGGNGNGAMNADSALQKIMAMDANGDGILTPAEVSDPQLRSLLQRADANADSQVTKAELQALLTSYVTNAVGGQGGFGGPGMGPPPGGMGGHRPGEIMPAFVMDQLQLTDAQRQQIAALQQQVDGQLAQILTAEQQQMLLQGPPGGGGGRRGDGQGGFAGPGGGPGGPPGQANNGAVQSGGRGRGGRGGGQK